MRDLNYECKIENKSSIRRELTISIQSSSIEDYLEKQFSSLQKTAQIKGFRPGKVPLALVKQYYAEDVESDTLSEIVNESYYRAIEDHKIFVVGIPQFETKSGVPLEPGKPLTFTANVEIMPEIKLSDFSKISLVRKSVELKDSDVEESLKRLIEARTEILPNPDYTGPAKINDMVDVSFEGTINQIPNKNLKGSNSLCEIGGKQFLKDFEDALIGMDKGETKEFDLPFPEDWPDKALASKKAKMKVTINEFKRKQVLTLDDEFAKQFKCESLSELKTKIRENLQEQLETDSKEKLREDLISALIEKNPFELPTALLRSQLEHLVEQFEREIKNGIAKIEELAKLAERQVRASLLLQEAAKVGNITIDDSVIEKKYGEIAKQANTDVQVVHEHYEKHANAKRELQFRLKESATIEYLYSQVKIKS